METEKELEDLLFNIASKNVPKSDQEPDIKEFIRKTNEIYETKIYEAADFKKLKPIAEKGNFHMNVIEMDSTYQYTCYELQRLVEKINSSGNLPLKVYYEKSERFDYDHTNLNTYYSSINCNASFRWKK